MRAEDVGGVALVGAKTRSSAEAVPVLRLRSLAVTLPNHESRPLFFLAPVGGSGVGRIES
jgi:hypothetical protein